MADKTIHVNILDRPFPLKVTGDNEDLTRRIASYVDSKMRAVKKSIPEHPAVTVAVVAALTIAEELFVERETNDMVPPEIVSQIAEIATQLEAALVTE